jgi:hypothetical protein
VTPDDVAATLLGGPRTTDRAEGGAAVGSAAEGSSGWAAEERTQLSCLATLFDDDVGSGAADWPRCWWGFKEPRLMYFAPLMHFGLGATKYFHTLPQRRNKHYLSACQFRLSLLRPLHPFLNVSSFSLACGVAGVYHINRNPYLFSINLPTCKTFYFLQK